MSDNIANIAILGAACVSILVIVYILIIVHHKLKWNGGKCKKCRYGKLKKNHINGQEFKCHICGHEVWF